MSIPALTAKQWLLVGYLRQHLAEFDRLPTMQQISGHFQWASANAANLMVRALVKKGVLETIDGGKVRFARLDLDAQELLDAALEHEIQAAGLRCQAAQLQAGAGCFFSAAGDAAHYAELQARLIAGRSRGQIQRMELERGLTGEAAHG